MANRYNHIVKDLGVIDGLPVVRVEGSNAGKFQKLHKFIVMSEDGEVLLETSEFQKKQDSLYFLRESCKKDAYLLGVCEIADGYQASGYKKNEIRVIDGKEYYRMSAYLYRWEGNDLLRWTYDAGAAYQRMDKGQRVATRNGHVITMLKKKATSKLAKSVQNPDLVRTDSGKAHEEDNSARGALEAWRRDLLS